MNQICVILCYKAFFVLALISPFLPSFLMWRVAGLSVVAFAAGRLIEGPVHWSDQKVGYSIGLAILLLFSGCVALAIIVRFVVAVARNNLNSKVFTGPDTPSRRWFDTAALVALGCTIGLYLTSFLATLLSGISIGQYLDLSIAISSAIFAVAFLYVSNRNIVITFSAAFAMIAVLAFVGSFQTNRILDGAEKLSNGWAWCLTTFDPSNQISEAGQLNFFSLAKGGRIPHLGLMKRVRGQTQWAAHWSIRQQKFIEESNSRTRYPTCHPIRDFKNALENGTIEKNVYAAGTDIYHIPSEYYPRAFTDRLSIRSDLLVGPDSAHPEYTDRIELLYHPSKPSVPDDAIPLSMMPNPDEIDITILRDGNRFTFAGVEGKTARNVILNCLRGPYAARVCHAQVFDGSYAYNFYLPLNEIQNWSIAADQVSNLFEGFRQYSSD